MYNTYQTTQLCRAFSSSTESFLERQDVLERYLEVDGSLIIEVDIQLKEDSKLVWYPKTIPTETSLKRLFVDAVAAMANNTTEEESENETTDIAFVVDNDEFRVHKLVLSLHAKTLFALYKEHADDDDNDDDDDLARVHISKINSNTFNKCIQFIYTVNTTPILVDAAAAIELLLAAHRLECVNLKLYVESVLVDKFITPTNAASMLLLGDTYHCALLKEAALQSSIEDPTSFRESSDMATAAAWSKIQESNRLLSELYVYTSNELVATRNPTATAAADIEDSTGETSGTASTGSNTDAVVAVVDDDTTRTMDVGELRDTLENANLGLDGSREMLVSRLRNYRQQ